jgi:hypothetical protein
MLPGFPIFLPKTSQIRRLVGILGVEETTMREAIVEAGITATKVYPTLDTDKSMDNLQTIGIRLTLDQWIRLVAVGMAGILRGWTTFDITCKRKPRKDGTHTVTVTSAS